MPIMLVVNFLTISHLYTKVQSILIFIFNSLYYFFDKHFWGIIALKFHPWLAAIMSPFTSPIEKNFVIRKITFSKWKPFLRQILINT